MFVYYSGRIVNSNDIRRIYLEELTSKGYIRIYFKPDNRIECVSGPEAFDVVMRLCPNALEGRQAKYAKHAWAIHNLIGHPLMQVLSWLQLPELGIKIHDATVPNPITK